MIIVKIKNYNLKSKLDQTCYTKYLIRSRTEAYYQLKNTLCVQSSTVHYFDSTRVEYTNDNIVLGIETENVLEARIAILNTRASV